MKKTDNELIEEFEVGLKKHFFGSSHTLTIGCLRYAKFDVAMLVADTFRANIHGYIFGEEIGTESIQIPSSWWQHFKLQCFPQWAKKWFPVKFNERKFSYHCLYPNFAPSLQGEAVVYLAEEDRERIPGNYDDDDGYEDED